MKIPKKLTKGIAQALGATAAISTVVASCSTSRSSAINPISPTIPATNVEVNPTINNEVGNQRAGSDEPSITQPNLQHQTPEPSTNANSPVTVGNSQLQQNLRLSITSKYPKSQLLAENTVNSNGNGNVIINGNDNNASINGLINDSSTNSNTFNTDGDTKHIETGEYTEINCSNEINGGNSACGQNTITEMNSN